MTALIALLVALLGMVRAGFCFAKSLSLVERMGEPAQYGGKYSKFWGQANLTPKSFIPCGNLFDFFGSHFLHL